MNPELKIQPLREVSLPYGNLRSQLLDRAILFRGNMSRRTFVYPGEKYGMLTVIKEIPFNKRRKILCVCDCGREVNIDLAELKRKKQKSISCGCYRRNKKRLTHGQTYTKLYKTWKTMIQRCHNKNNTGYYLYGQRGISVCEEWRKSFEQFHKDMGEKPSPIHTIDRIDNDGNYEATNCRWATPKEQSANRRNTKRKVS